MEIFNLRNIPENLLPNVGGKVRGLNTLAKSGFNIGEGFIIYGASIDDDFSLVIEKYHEMNMTYVAVRSSASMEDGQDFSNAGQFDTYLDINSEEELISAVKKCIASLDNDTAKDYAEKFLNGQKASMCVIVEEMIPAQVAGVMFTAHPSIKDAILVEAVKGIGEQLVSGSVSAKQYVIKKDGSYEGDSDLLNKEEIKEFFVKAKEIEKIFKQPMDVEWAINQKRHIKWLQVRPITVNETVDIHEFDNKLDMSKSVLTTDNISEVAPGAVTPLTLSTNIYALDYGMRKMLVKIGCYKNLNECPPFTCFVPYSNHLYMNLSSIYRATRSTFGANKSSIEWSICGRALADMPDVDLKYKNIFARIRYTVPFLKYAMKGKGAVKGILKEGAKVKFNLTDDIKDTYKQINDQKKIFDEVYFYHYWSSFYSGSQYSTAVIMLSKYYSSREEIVRKLTGALAEIDGIESADILHMMTKVGEIALKVHPEIEKYSAQEIEKYLANPEKEVKDAFDSFMKKHGHRGIREPEMRSLPLRNDTKTFAENLKSVIYSIKHPSNISSADWKKHIDEVLVPVPKYMKGTIRKFILGAREAVVLREFTKSRCIYCASQFKDAYLHLAKLLEKNKILPDYDLIYFLTHEEIGELINGKSSLIKKAIARRRLYDTQMELKFPEFSLGNPSPLVNETDDKNKTIYTGTPVSTGIAKGKARVVRTLEDANKLRPGEIMVAGFTDIGWSPYYSLAAGLVTEIGSFLSHGVVVAREYALPTVVNISNVLNIIKTGDTLIVDGEKGTVQIVRD